MTSSVGRSIREALGHLWVAAHSELLPTDEVAMGVVERSRRLSQEDM